MEEEKKMQEAVEDKRPSWEEYFMEMAELTAQEIYEIRESRGMLAKGQADFWKEQVNLAEQNKGKNADE